MCPNGHFQQETFWRLSKLRFFYFDRKFFLWVLSKLHSRAQRNTVEQTFGENFEISSDVDPKDFRRVVKNAFYVPTKAFNFFEKWTCSRGIRKLPEKKVYILKEGSPYRNIKRRKIKKNSETVHVIYWAPKNLVILIWALRIIHLAKPEVYCLW